MPDGGQLQCCQQHLEGLSATFTSVVSRNESDLVSELMHTDLTKLAEEE